MDIDEISQDEALFSHLVDETLSFEHEMRELVKISYLSSFPTAITVLTQPQFLMQWLRIEEKCKFLMYSSAMCIHMINI